MNAPCENFLAQDAPPCSSKILLGTVLVLLAASRAHSPGPFVTPFALVSRKILAGSLVAFILASMLSGRELVLAGGQGHLVVEDVSVLLGVSAVASCLIFGCNNIHFPRRSQSKRLSLQQRRRAAAVAVV